MPTLPINWMNLLKSPIGGFGPELYTLANAASDPNGNEADAITGWSEFGLNGVGANVFESQGVIKNAGSYSLHTDAEDTPTNLARIYIDIELAPFNFVDGEKGVITFDMRHIGGSGATWRAYFSNTSSGVTNLVASVTNVVVTFQSIEYEWTHDNNHQYFLVRESGSGNNGGIYLDNISIRKIL